jgi:SAM-dependent methyltransferase
VRGFIKQYADGVFDPAVLSILGDAFENAWRRVQASKAPYGTEEFAAALTAGKTLTGWRLSTTSKGSWRDDMNLKDKISLVAHSYAALGVIETFKALVRYALRPDTDDVNFDNKFGTNTASQISNENLDMPDPDAQRSATQYRTTPERFVRLIISSLNINYREYDFVDVGCGKGRVLLIASSYPFRSIRGVELSKPAYALAENNLRIYKSPDQKCFDVRVYNVDALHFEPSIANTVYYLFAPFDRAVLMEFLTKIASRLKGRGKTIKVVCVWRDFLSSVLPLIASLGFEIEQRHTMLVTMLNYQVFSLRSDSDTPHTIMAHEQLWLSS